MENKTYAQKILEDYTEKELTKTDELKSLDKKVRKTPFIFAIVFGLIGSLVLGIGMCLAMKVIFATVGWAFYLGLGVGILGIAMVSVNYYIYQKMLKNRKKKYSSKIIDLSNSILDK